jgi:hypothetical protein
MDSILKSIKKMLNVHGDDDSFDTDIITLINSTFVILHQIGVGPADGFMIMDEGETWGDFIPDADDISINSVKTYIYLKVRLVFDPPSSSSVMEAINKNVNELEWRLNVMAESRT